MLKLISVLLLLAVSASAHQASDIVHWAVTSPTSTVKPGQKLSVTLDAKIASGWHVYSITQAPGGCPY